ncbi:hypothetical protein QBC46DRAFT_339519 [Diplogelasinospora grovesii]|uniref:Uncharacterized protein n=1 Tax=Diplogelasinospora grovesii TaxID=303347 RepID=A0AAN6NCA4_9PEZI|nr:hypothetical protein QBC46DRAFT_339519 [Diplogelasinospora grovesii]
MRLLHVNTLAFEECSGEVGDGIPSYAILSHTWGNDEVSYKDHVDQKSESKKGYDKIRAFADSREDGLSRNSLAPADVIFLGSDWAKIGTKKGLQATMSRITRSKCKKYSLLYKEPRWPEIMIAPLLEAGYDILREDSGRGWMFDGSKYLVPREFQHQDYHLGISAPLVSFYKVSTKSNGNDSRHVPTSSKVTPALSMQRDYDIYTSALARNRRAQDLGDDNAVIVEYNERAGVGVVSLSIEKAADISSKTVLISPGSAKTEMLHWLHSSFTK